MTERQTQHPQRGRAPTLIDVAKVAGVSPITVSRALNQPERVSEKARAKVAAAVEKTGYLPNMLAGSLATQSSRLVALIVPTIANPIFAETVRAITETLEQAGYQTLLGLSGYSEAQEQDLLEAILCRRPDGIILTGLNHTGISRTRLKAAAIPIVETWDLGEQPLDALVGFSHREVGHAVGQYLLNQGHRRFVAISADDQRAEARLAGFIQALEEAGLTPEAVERLETPARFSQGRQAFAHLLERGIRAEAVYCSSDTLAQGVMTEARARGIDIPGDMALIGFGDLDFAAHTLPSLSSVQINGAEIGYRAARHLLNAMTGEHPPTDPVTIDVGFQIVRRDSA